MNHLIHKQLWCACCLIGLVGLGLTGACSSSSSVTNTTTDTGVAAGADTGPLADAGRTDGGSSLSGTSDGGCYSGTFTSSTPYIDFLNACTTAQYLDKMPLLPTYADGGLPPLGTNPLPTKH